jgi:hypothetical protein
MRLVSIPPLMQHQSPKTILFGRHARFALRTLADIDQPPPLEYECEMFSKCVCARSTVCSFT